MKIPTIIVLLLSLIMVSNPARCGAENLQLAMDGREWELGYNEKNDQQGIKEYVLKGETVNNWTELITVQAFFGLQKKVTPEAFKDSMVQNFRQTCADLKWNLIRKSDTDIVFEWEITACPGQDNQYEIDRIIIGKTAIWYLHYATKKTPVSSDKRDEWIRLLDAATLQ